MISILHPSRSRPSLAYAAASQWTLHIGCDYEYILSLDEDDPLLYRYAEGFHFQNEDKKVIINKNQSAIDAINNAAKISKGTILVVMSDDFRCFPNWGHHIKALTKRTADWILKTNDGIQDWVITLPIMDRIYYERFGYIYHPSYKHNFCDTEMTCVAELTQCKLVSDMSFLHLNKEGTKIIDAVSRRNDATFNEGKKNFIERKKKNFDLINPPGMMSVNVYTQMK
jgi:hypothetical protein